MLILNRFPGESFKIGDDIEVTYLGSLGHPGKPSQGRIGIAAPKDLTILRTEVKDRDKDD